VSGQFDVTAIEPGTVLLDKYRVQNNLGVGGMGVVVAAEHLQLGHKVAIKFLLPELTSNPMLMQRFVNEAKAATRINSEHVARVVDVGTLTGPEYGENGVPYMVMEYLEGKDLQVHVRTGKRFPVNEAIAYIAQAAEALAQAHKVNIIHRDIKPANLFLLEDSDGNKKVKVLDFGISKLLDEQPQEMGLTKTTTVLGSGLYMSPEQMRSAKSVDFRTDIYSLGVCMYELLTGTQPFTAETFSELCVKVNIDPPTPIQKWRPDIPEPLAAVIAKAYARSPSDRYQTVQAFIAALLPYAGQHAPMLQQVQGVTAAEGQYPSTPPPALGTGALGTGPHAAIPLSMQPQAMRSGPHAAIPVSMLQSAAASVGAITQAPQTVTGHGVPVAPTPSPLQNNPTTAGAVTAHSAPTETRGKWRGVAIALSAIVLAAGATIALISSNNSPATASSANQPTPTATTSAATPTATAEPEPTPSANATASAASPGSSATASSATASAEPASSGAAPNASATASAATPATSGGPAASTSATAAIPTPPWPRRPVRPPATAKPSAKPKLKCIQKRGPDGLLIPCDLQ